MKDTLKLALLAGGLFALGMGVAFSLLAGPDTGLVAGAFAGAAFGGVVGLFGLFVERKTRGVLSDLVPGKSLLMDGGASHYMGVEEFPRVQPREVGRED